MALTGISRKLARAVDRLSFADPVTHVYNPLDYAWAAHQQYLERYGVGPKEAVFVGMNPGPFGMAQTGVPFGEVSLVRDFLGIDAKVRSFAGAHPKRPVEGFACLRSEVSGARLWGWVRDRFGAPEHFFARFFVVNYCPLLFLEESGRNRTPDKLPAHERQPLEEACDAAMRAMLDELRPRLAIGVGAFAEKRLRHITKTMADAPVVGTVLHPSPASPLANRGWAAAAERQLADLGIDLN